MFNFYPINRFFCQIIDTTSEVRWAPWPHLIVYTCSLGLGQSFPKPGPQGELSHRVFSPIYYKGSNAVGFIVDWYM